MKKSSSLSMSKSLKKILCCGMKSFFSDLPPGHVKVYVGKDAPCKFELAAIYLNHPLLENLLQLSVDEFGYSYDGAVRISCDIDLFQHVLELLESRNPKAHYMDLPELISKFYGRSAGHL